LAHARASLWKRASEPAGGVRGEDQQHQEQDDEHRDAAPGGPHRGSAGHQAHLTAAFPLRTLALFEILGRLLDDAGVDPTLAVRVARQEAVIAYDVDDPRRAAGVLGD